VFPRELMVELLDACLSRGVFVISDEIYTDISFEVASTSALELVGARKDAKETLPLLAVVSGVSKAYAMTGFRVGWTRADPALVTLLTKLQEPVVSCVSGFAQAGAEAAVRGTAVVRVITPNYPSSGARVAAVRARHA
jgi:aspartate aminotransferase